MDPLADLRSETKKYDKELLGKADFSSLVTMDPGGVLSFPVLPLAEEFLF